MRILELSKVLMFEFLYDYIDKYENKSELFFTGTDSLMHEINTEDDYGDFSSDKIIVIMFDFSNSSAMSK